MRFWDGFGKRPGWMLVFVAASLLVVPGTPGRAQDSLDPSDIWYRGFLLVQSAEELENQGDFLGSLNKLTEAKPLYDHLAQAFPNFQPEIVRERRHLIAEKRDELKTRMRQARTSPQAPSPSNPGYAGPAGRGTGTSISDLSSRPPRGSEFSSRSDFDTGSSRALPSSPPHSYGARSRQMEVEQSDGEFALPSWDDGASQALPRVSQASGMPRVRTSRSSASTPSVGAIANSLHEDLARKDSLISWLNEENQKLRRELSSREAMLETMRSELARARASREELLRRVRRAEEQGGVDAQRKVEQLKTLLRDATRQLQEATDRNAQLVAALDHSQKEMGKLRGRISELERERDNLAEVVRGEGNGGKALKELMDRNRQLTEQLDRAEQLASSLSELNKSKDEDIAFLKSEIAKVKLERDRLLAENLRHAQSIQQLQRKLELLSDGLTTEEKNSLTEATPVERRENELLRSIVLKQLRRQARTKQAKELLLKQLDKVGARSETLLGLVEDMATGSQLTEEEKNLFRAPQFREIVEAASTDSPAAVAAPDPAEASDSVSATLVAPGSGPAPASEDDVIRDQKVSVELAQLDKAARLDFQEGRYSEAEAGFLEYLRYRPRSISCLCNLGVLKMALENYSEAEYYLEKALAIDEESGLAHYLLGRVYFLQDKLDEALARLETGLDHDPRNAKAHNCVGVISTRKGWVARAEKAFTHAVSIDPEYGDAHFNLAVLYATREEPDPTAAEKHYFRALHLGVPRDASMEDFLKEAEAAGTSIGMR